jgi:DNA-directed RNA polymerase specialized sigma24 family protein
MPNDGSVTHWIRLLEAGEHEAAQPLWERYFSSLKALADRKLGGRPPAIADAEDVALSAFDSLCLGLRRGRFPQLEDRDNLWKLLVVITARKAAHLLRDQHSQKRGGLAGNADAIPLDEIIGPAPRPDFAAQISEEYERLLAVLPHDDLRRIAGWKLEAYTNAEIAAKLGCARRTVDRKLRLIRGLWEEAVPKPSDA